ncbi:intermembrane lipid transfer protein Vps13 isoform X4 [Dermacentor andersoni]|uniref:intermembrane lipid transfer protein Vps13 isoform X4 n=1 Tax=Dermacentor andersoni TaxID=34620 RepID=UPI0024165EB2|nr:intermembrane lipid transfer protein Vps13-like isoform X4 [Dermacentor andersoni]
MVFESVVVELVNYVLGDYIENLDTSQLKLGIWGGDINLKDLDIKQSAIDDLDLPFRVAYGHIEKLTLKIPWQSLYSATYSAMVEGIYMVIVPKSGVKYDAAKEQKLQREAKQRELARIELVKQQEAEKDKPKEEKQDTFVEKLAAQIIKNLQVRIRNIHIRYEDNFTIPEHPFSFGITLYNLSFDTTNEEWEPCVLDVSARIVHKLVDVSSFGLYWNPDCKLFMEQEQSKIKLLLQEKISNEAVKPADVSYMLGPISSLAKLTMDTKPEINNYSTTGMVLDIVVAEISIGISKRQFQDMLALSDSVNRMTIAAHYRKYRPDVPVHNNAKRWWHFAYEAILEEYVRRRRRNWSLKHMHEHVLKVKAYKTQYKVKLQTKQSSENLKALEDELDVFNITLARRQAELEVEEQQLNTPKQSWLSSWWFGGDQSGTASQTQDIAKQFEKAMTPAEKEKLYAAIGYQENSSAPIYPVTYVAKRLNFLLKNFSLAIHDEARVKTIIVQVILNDMSASFEERPRTEAMKLESKIEKFKVLGFPQEPSEFCTLISSEIVQGNEKKTLLTFLFETNPLDDKCDQRVHLLAEPVEMIYDAAVISALADVFSPPEQATLDKLQARAVSKLNDIKAMSATGLQHAIEQRKALEVLVDLKPSYLVVHEGGRKKDNKLLLVISFGQLYVHGLPRSRKAPTVRELVKSGSTESEVMQVMISQAYEKYTVRVTATEIVVCPPEKEWKSLLRSGNSELHVLQPTDVLVEIDKCIIADNVRLPKVRVTGKLPLLRVSVTDFKLVQVLKVLNSIPTAGASTPPKVVEAAPVIPLAERELPTKIETTSALNVVSKGESTSSSEGAPRQDFDTTDLELNFEITEVALDISQTVQGVLKPVVVFQAQQLSLKLDLRPLDMRCQLCLKKTLLQHMDFSAPNRPGPLKILDSTADPETGSTISLIIVQTNKKHPDFDTVRGSVLQKVTLDISELMLIMHEESICALVTLYTHLTDELGSLDKEPKVSETQIQATTAAKPLGSKPPTRSRRSTNVVVSMDLFASLTGFALEICNKNRTICDILVRGMEYGMTWYPTKLVTRLNLKTVGIGDPTPGTLHKNILAVPGDEVIAFEITTYEECGALGYVQMDRVDIDIRGRLGQLHFVLLYRFYLDIYNFVNRFQAAKAKIMEATASMAEAARATVETAYKQAYKMAMDIRIEAPIICLPQNCKSRNILVMDFGVLHVHNKFKLDENSTPELPCLLEEMVVAFDNLKLSRFCMKVPNSQDDDEYPLLLPVSFKLLVVRNMNFETHPEVPEMKNEGVLPKIELILSEEDYCAIMRTLDENLNEIPPEDEPLDWSKIPVPVVTNAPYPIEEVYTHEHTDPVLSTDYIDVKKEIKRAVRIDLSFQIDYVVLDLYVKRSSEGKEGLARLEIELLSVKGHMFHDGSYWMDTVLGNLVVDDTRVTRKTGLTRFLTRSSRSKDKLVDVLYKVDKNGDFFTQIDLSKITFVYCVDFFNAIMSFYYMDSMYKKADEKRKQQQQQATKRQQPPQAQASVTDTTSPPMPPYPLRNYTVQLEMDKPDIVLVADIDDPQSACIIMKGSIHQKLRQVGTTQSMMVLMDDLRMFTSYVDKFQSEHIRSEILKPTEISLNSTFTVESGQHMEINFSPIEIHVTPGAVEILSKSLGSLSAPSAEQKADHEVEPDNSEVWNIMKLDKAKLWFLEEPTVPMAMEAMETMEAAPATQESQAPRKDEQALVTAKSIVITLEQGAENRTVPVLLWKASLEAEVLDWSGEMSVRGFLGSVIFYYNEKLAVWEPLVEPIEVPGGRKVWEIALKIDKHIGDEDVLNAANMPPMFSIELLVEDTLEVTISQTTLQVLKDLGEAFSAALVKAPTEHKRLDAPYVVKNYLGIAVHVILEGTPFRVAAPNVDDDIDEVILEPDAMVQLTFKETSEQKGRFAGTLVELSQQNVTEANFAIQVKEAGVSAVRKVCVTYADKRYFTLPIKTYPGDDWAFIVDTTSHYGSKLVMIYSICKIVNHLSVPIEVYYLVEGDKVSEVFLCGVIEPHKVLHLPVRALYTKTSELFFKPVGEKYRMSMEPFVWKPHSVDHNSILQCPSKTEENKFFYINVSGKTEPVKYDDSIGKVSTMPLFSIELQPTVLVRNLLSCSLYVKLENMSKLFCLEAGQGVELWNAEIGESTLLLKLHGYRDMEWSCKTRLESTMDELSVLTFETAEGPQMDLGMHVETTNNCIVLGLYCPFWMVNKTTEDISYKPGEDRRLSLRSQSSIEKELSPGKTEDSAGIPHPASFEGPVLFSYRSKTLFTKKKAAIKIFNSEWSERFSLDAVGSSGTIIAKSKDGHSYLLSVGITLSATGLTRIVTFTPYYLVLNNCKTTVEIKEYTENSVWMRILPGACVPFWPKEVQKLELLARYADTEECTVPFSCKETNSILLKLANKKGGLYMACQVSESAAVVSFGDYEDGLSPVFLVNQSSAALTYCQHGYRDMSIYSLPPKTAAHYTWDNPMSKRCLLWGPADCAKLNKLELLMDDCDQIQLKDDRKLFWIAFLNGRQRTLLFTEDSGLVFKIQESGALERNIYDMVLNVQAVGISLVTAIPRREIIYISITGSGVKWESKKETKNYYKAVSTKESNQLELQYQRYNNLRRLDRDPPSVLMVNGYEVDFKQMKVMSNPKKDLRRLARPGIWATYKKSQHQTMVHAKLHLLQVDNQIADCTFPVILTPVTVRRSLGEGMIPKPFFETSVIMRQFDYSQVRQFKYFKVLVQELHARVDQCFINVIGSFLTLNEREANHEELLEKDRSLTRGGLKEIAEQFSEQGVKDFFDMLHFSPIKLHLSFSLSADSKNSSGSLFNLLLQSFGVTFTEIQDAVLKLDYFEKSNTYLTMHQLINEASNHYFRQTLKQIYVVVLGLDVIGNPVGLLTGFTTGVGDFFYEPLQGAIQGPEEFAEGLATGVRSLIGHTVGGAAGAVSRITGTLGKGIAALTMDDEYQRRRRLEQNRRPNDIAEGFAQGGRDLVMGVYEGMTGIFTKPMAGAREEGVSGFFKGVGKGLIGAVARPTGGVVDFASGSFDAVKRATDFVDEVRPVRPARFIKPDGIIRPYNLMEAQGNRLLQDVDKGKYAETDVYVAHVCICEEGRNILLVTNRRVMFVLKGDVFGQWNAEWTYSWEEVKEPPTVSSQGIKILLKEPKKKALFGSKETGKIIHIKDMDVAKFIAQRIEEAMKKPL